MKIDVKFSKSDQSFTAALEETGRCFDADVGEVQIVHDVQNGATFYPSVSDDGIISWTNDRELDNPIPVNIRGKDGYTPVKCTDYWTTADKAEIIEDLTEQTAPVSYKAQTLTEAQKAQARANLGVDDAEWVKIESFKTTENILSIERTAGPDGTPYDLLALKIRVASPPGQAKGTYDISIDDEKGRIIGVVSPCYENKADNANWYRSTVIAMFLPMCGQYLPMISSGSQGATQTWGGANNAAGLTESTARHIKKVECHIYNNIEIVAGSEVEIWGVRA